MKVNYPKLEDIPLQSHYMVAVKCDCCGKEYEIRYAHYIENVRRFNGNNYCHKCITSTLSAKSHDQFVEDINNKYGDGEFTPLETYVKGKEKILIQHNNCFDGETYIFEVRPNSFLSHLTIGCPKCALESRSNKARKTKEQFIQEVHQLENNDYNVIGNYINCDTKILMRHNICMNEFEVSPDCFLRGQRCPFCANSHKSFGEGLIMKILNNYNIHYDIQYKIPECKNILPLPFDFAIYKDSDKTKLLCLIEYQGEQHYFPQRFGGRSKEDAEIWFKYTQYNDKIKRDFCDNNNIRLILIPYWERNNIDKIIHDILFLN